MKLKELLPPRGSKGNKFFSSRVHLILKGLHCPGKHAGSHKSCLPLQKWQKNIEVYPNTLNCSRKVNSSATAIMLFV